MTCQDTFEIMAIRYVLLEGFMVCYRAAGTVFTFNCIPQAGVNLHTADIIRVVVGQEFRHDDPSVGAEGEDLEYSGHTSQAQKQDGEQRIHSTLRRIHGDDAVFICHFIAPSCFFCILLIYFFSYKNKQAIVSSSLPPHLQRCHNIRSEIFGLV